MGRGHELAIVMRKSYWLMHRRTEECFRAASVTAEQFVVLSILVEFGPMNQRQLADRASTDPNTLRAILKLLEARKLIVRQLDPNDGRAWIVTTTKSGRALYRKLWASSEPLRQSWLDRLSPESVESLILLLEAFAKCNEPRAMKSMTKLAGSVKGSR